MTRARPLLVLTLLVGVLAALPAPGSAAASGYKYGAFSSPSKNIGCSIGRKYVRCDIRNKDWSAPKPKGCELDYGQGLTVQRGWRKGRVVCAGDTAVTGAKALPYGKTIRRGGNRCTSSEAGMTCKNRRGHGFFIAKQRYKLF